MTIPYADELRRAHRNFARYLARRAPPGWKLKAKFEDLRLKHYEITMPNGETAICPGDYSDRITEGWNVEQKSFPFYSDLVITAPDGTVITFSDIDLA
jgi:hypothetical protein